MSDPGELEAERRARTGNGRTPGRADVSRPACRSIAAPLSSYGTCSIALRTIGDPQNARIDVASLGWRWPSSTGHPHRAPVPRATLTRVRAAPHTRQAGAAPATAQSNTDRRRSGRVRRNSDPPESRGRCKPGGFRATEWPREPRREPRRARSSRSGNCPRYPGRPRDLTRHARESPGQSEGPVRHLGAASLSGVAPRAVGNDARPRRTSVPTCRDKPATRMSTPMPHLPAPRGKP